MVSVEQGLDRPEIGHLWVRPATQCQGCRRRLVEAAVEFAAANEWHELRILSDPNAVPFYMTFGAVHVSDAPAPVAGIERTLPVLRLSIGE